MSRAPEPHVDYAALAEFLKALAYPTRLEILDALRFPRTVGEIKVAPQRTEEGDNPERSVARQTLQAHLDKLLAADLVRDEEVALGERTIRRYAVNSQKLYAVTEELRRLSTRHAGRGAEAETTFDDADDGLPRSSKPKGPRLVLVHGMYEGKSYHLDDALAKDGAWIIGRKRGLPVSLDYDPFVSTENSRVTRSSNQFSIEDMSGSRNGTRVNWESLPKSLPRVLEPGDVVGVGRSLLVFTAT